MRDEHKVLERQACHLLVIKEKKNKDRDEHVLQVIKDFKALAKIYAMDNYIMMLDIFIQKFLNKDLPFDELFDQLQSVQLQVQELNDKVAELKTKEKKENQKSSF